jgi:PAS domain S-box-containing protein
LLATDISKAPDAGADGALREMNPAGLAMIEADSLEQVRGRSVYRHIAPGHRGAFVALTEKVLRGGSGTLEFELVGLKGTRRWLDTHAVPLRDAGGEAAGLLAITRDITQRKEAEKGLRDAKFKYRTLVERIPATIYIQMPQFGGASAYAVAYMSPQVEKLLGHPAQRFMEDPRFWNSVTHPDDLVRMVVETERTDRTGEPFAVEYRMLHEDGDYRWIRDEAVLVRNEQGSPMYWQGVFSDVTERKRAEDAMQESERLYRTVIEQATENIFLIDVETRRIVESNRAFREALGYTEGELHRMTLYDVVAADRESVDLNLRWTLKEGRATVGERRYRRKDGTLLDVEAGGSVIVRDGRQTLVAVAHDITERARAQHMLEERVATLAEAGMTEMRALIFELRPESLEKEGLVAALEKQAAAVQARHGIRVEAVLGREPEASLEVKETLYRIAQEALHNTVKHARAANVKLKLEELPDGFALGISDDGLGFDTRKDFPGHLGLKSMRERATRLGGTLEVTSEPGRGVHILARIPR